MKTAPFFILLSAFVLAGTPRLRSAGAPDNAPPSMEDMPSAERFFEYFQPFRTTAVSLSPDGKYVAYSVRNSDKLWLYVVAMDQPDKVVRSYFLGSDADATPMFTDNDEPTPIAITWMGWVTPERLVVETNLPSVTHVMHSSHSDNSSVNNQSLSRMRSGDQLSSKYGAPRGTAMNHEWMSSIGIFTAIDIKEKKENVILTGRDFASLILGLRGITPVFYDYAKDDPESIIVRGQSLQNSYFAKLNVRTGKLTIYREETGDMKYTMLFDRTGHGRLGTETSPTSFPIHYVLQKEGLISLGRWNYLDEALSSKGGTAFTVSPVNCFGERAIPMGFDENPDILYYASNVGRDTFGIYATNVKTGQQMDFAIEKPGFDLIEPTTNQFPSGLVFDRFDRKLAGVRYDATCSTAHWLKPELEAAQRELETTFKGKNVEILEWDQNHEQLLALVHSTIDPGSYVIYQPVKKRCYDLIRRTPWTDHHAPHRVMSFSVDAPDGQKINGTLTFPASARFPTVPVVVRCPTQPWLRAPLGFQPETMALADMGFAVLQVESRGAWGYGIKQRETYKNGYENTLIDDIVVAVDQLSRKYRINPQRVALMGEGYGGYIALRGLQIAPNRFRCAVTIEAPIDLRGWMEYDRWTKHNRLAELIRPFYGTEAALKDSPLAQHPEQITKPVCLLAFPGPDGAPRTEIYLETRQFVSALRSQKTPVELNEIDKNYIQDNDSIETAASAKSSITELNRESAQHLPHAQAAVYRHIENFLNAYIYDYQVKLGPLKTLPDLEK